MHDAVIFFLGTISGVFLGAIWMDYRAIKKRGKEAQDRADAQWSTYLQEKRAAFKQRTRFDA